MEFNTSNALMIRGGFDCQRFAPFELETRPYEFYSLVPKLSSQLDQLAEREQLVEYQMSLTLIFCLSAGEQLLAAVAQHVKASFAILNDGNLSRNYSQPATQPLDYLINNSIDIALTPYLIQPHWDLTSFTQPLDTVAKQYVMVISAVHFPVVTTHQFNWVGLLRPYHFWTWLTVLFAALLCTLLLAVTWGWIHRWKPSIGSLLEQVMRIFFEQDTPSWLSKSSKAATALLLGWGFLCAIFCNVYKSELLSAMTVDLRVNNTPFYDFVSMQEAGFKLAGVRGYHELLVDNLREETNGTADGEALRKVLLPQREWPKTQNESFHLQLNSSTKLVLFAESDHVTCSERMVNIAYETKRNQRRPTKLPNLNGAYKVPKEVGHQTKISKAVHRQLARLQESGLWLASERKQTLATELLVKNAAQGRKACEKAKQLNPQYLAVRDKTPLNFMQLVSPFLLLTAGILSGVIVYAVEHRSQFLFGIFVSPGRRQIALQTSFGRTEAAHEIIALRRTLASSWTREECCHKCRKQDLFPKRRRVTM